MAIHFPPAPDNSDARKKRIWTVIVVFNVSLWLTAFAAAIYLGLG